MASGVNQKERRKMTDKQFKGLRFWLGAIFFQLLVATCWIAAVLGRLG